MPLKRCLRCGTFSQDADVVCGICGNSIANTPILKGGIEDEVLRDRNEAERQSTLLKQKFARASKGRLSPKLVKSIFTITIGSTTVTYAMLSISSLGPVHAGDFATLLDLFALLGGFTLIILGLNLGIKGAGGGGLDAHASAISNQAMRATYKGQLLSKEQQDEKKPSD